MADVNPVEEGLMLEPRMQLMNNDFAPPASPIDFLGEEIPLDQLMGPDEDGFQDQPKDVQMHVDEHMEQIEPPPGPLNGPEHAQVGLAITRFQEVDPVWTMVKQAEATRFWATFVSSGNTLALHLNIPSPWANLFTFLFCHLL